MLSYIGMVGDKYRISDGEDGVIDTVSYAELLECVTVLGIKIKGVIYSKRYGRLLCEVISGGKRKSTEFFKEEVYNLVGDDYTVLGEYTRNHVGMRFRHNVCGYEYTQEPRLFLDGKRCPKCFRLVKGDTESFKAFVKSAVGDEYSVLSEYTGADEAVKMRHNVCGYVYSVVVANFKRGQRCPKCTKPGTKLRSFKEVAALVKKRSSNYELVEYVRAVTPMKIRHLVCGTVFEMKPYAFLHQNGRCPVCRKSVPEHLLQLELQKRFDCECNYWSDCLRNVSGYRMELDVYIPSLKTAVEYDGYFYHLDRVAHDEFKDKCCRECGIRVIRLREYGLPELEDGSVQLLATNQITLNKLVGVEAFETLMTKLLGILGVDAEYKIDMQVLQKLYENNHTVSL